MHWSKFLKPIKPGGTAILQPLKTQGVAMGIGLLSILIAYWVEPLVPPEALDILVVSILTALGVSLWIQLRSPRIAIGCPVLAISFHYCCGSCLVRQAALTALMAGSVLALWSEYRQSKTKPKSKI